MKFEKEYAVFSIVNFVLILVSISVPYFVSSFHIARLYHITLFFLAPMCVIGGITVFRMLNRIIRVTWTNKSVRSSLKVLSVYFVIFMLYSTGFVYEVAEGHSGSISLGDGDHICYNEREAIGAQWLSLFSNSKSRVYSDEYGRTLLGDWFHLENVNRQRYHFPLDIKRMQKNAYIYLRSWNIEKHELLIVYTGPKGLATLGYVNYEDVPEFLDTIRIKNKIYDNGGSQIFAPGRQ